jgi:hypothetical protein
MFRRIINFGLSYKAHSLALGTIIVLANLAICNTSNGNEEVDLNLLISSYQATGITVSDLATFLTEHGYHVQPSNYYVTAKLSGGKDIYLVPDGTGPNLATLWIVPPSSHSKQSTLKHSEPVPTIEEGAIKKNEIYKKTSNGKFIETIGKSAKFPATPLGMCENGAQILAKAYRDLGYNVCYMVDPSSDNRPGHMWIVVGDPDNKNTWLAVDSYFGTMTKDDKYYYNAPYSFKDIKYLKLIEPVLRVS